MGRHEQSRTYFSPQQDLSRYIDRFPVLNSEQQKQYAKQFSTIEIATYLLQDIQTGIREEKRRLTPPTARGDDQKNPILSKEVGDAFLADLHLTGKIKLITDEKEEIKTGKQLTDEEKTARKAIIGYQWQEEIITTTEKETLGSQLETQIASAKNAKNTLINHNLRLVASVARDYKRPIPEEDRRQAGFFGLVRAVEKFDYRKGYEFSTYATDWIKQSIQREAYKQNSDIHLPQGLKQALQAISLLADEYEKDNNEHPRETELVDLLEQKKLKISDLDKKDAVTIFLSNQISTFSLDKPLSDDPNVSLKDFIIDKTASIEESVQNKMTEEALGAALSNLSDIEKKVIGLIYWSKIPKQQIADELGITLKQVRVIQERAQRNLKKTPELSKLYEEGEKISIDLPQQKTEITQKPKIPTTGVTAETFAFLQAAKASGVFYTIEEQYQNLIDTYYNTDASLAQIGHDTGIGSKQRTHRLLFLNLSKIWLNLPPSLQQKYPKGETLVPKKQKISQETRAKISAKVKEAREGLEL